MSMEKFNPFVVLNVPIGATNKEVKKSYKEKILNYHTDKLEGLSKEEFLIAKQKADQLIQSMEILCDHKQRSCFEWIGYETSGKGFEMAWTALESLKTEQQRMNTIETLQNDLEHIRQTLVNIKETAAKSKSVCQELDGKAMEAEETCSALEKSLTCASTAPATFEQVLLRLQDAKHGMDQVEVLDGEQIEEDKTIMENTNNLSETKKNFVSHLQSIKSLEGNITWQDYIWMLYENVPEVRTELDEARSFVNKTQKTNWLASDNIRNLKQRYENMLKWLAEKEKKFQKAEETDNSKPDEADHSTKTNEEDISKQDEADHSTKTNEEDNSKQNESDHSSKTDEEDNSKQDESDHSTKTDEENNSKQDESDHSSKTNEDDNSKQNESDHSSKTDEEDNSKQDESDHSSKTDNEMNANISDLQQQLLESTKKNGELQFEISGLQEKLQSSTYLLTSQNENISKMQESAACLQKENEELRAEILQNRKRIDKLETSEQVMITKIGALEDLVSETKLWFKETLQAKADEWESMKQDFLTRQTKQSEQQNQNEDFGTPKNVEVECDTVKNDKNEGEQKQNLSSVPEDLSPDGPDNKRRKIDKAENKELHDNSSVNTTGKAKSYACSECGKSFAHSSSMYRHRATHFKDKK